MIEGTVAAARSATIASRAKKGFGEYEGFRDGIDIIFCSLLHRLRVPAFPLLSDLLLRSRHPAQTLFKVLFLLDTAMIPNHLPIKTSQHHETE